MGFFRRTRRAVKETGIIVLRGVAQYSIGKTKREIKELERKKEAYQSIGLAFDQLFRQSQADVIHDYVTNEKVN